MSGLLIIALAASLGCASVRKVLPERKERVEVDEVEELKRNIVELQRRATMAEVEVERLRRQVAELSTGEDQARPHTSPAPSSPVPDYQVSEYDAAERTTPEHNAPASGTPDSREVDSAGRNLSAPVVIEEAVLEVADLDPVDSRPAAEGDISDMTAALPGPAAPGSQDRPTVEVSEEGQALYDRGYTMFHRGQYLDSEAEFQRFLADFGSSDLADNAQFWIGEARYARRDLAGAMAAFREVGSRYPEGNKVPDSQLKVGDCQRELGDISGARKTYQEVVAGFPVSAAAAVAEDRLRELP